MKKSKKSALLLCLLPLCGCESIDDSTSGQTKYTTSKNASAVDTERIKAEKEARASWISDEFHSQIFTYHQQAELVSSLDELKLISAKATQDLAVVEQQYREASSDPPRAINEYRQWTSFDGAFTRTAKVIAINDDSVELEIEGQEDSIVVKTSLLSETDRDFLVQYPKLLAEYEAALNKYNNRKKPYEIEPKLNTARARYRIAVDKLKEAESIQLGDKPSFESVAEQLDQLVESDPEFLTKLVDDEIDRRERERLNPTIYTAHVNVVDSIRVTSEYRDNAVAADGQFADRTHIIKGVIDVIGSDSFNGAYVTLLGEEGWIIKCKFDAMHVDKLATLSKGQRVRIRGTVRRGTMFETVTVTDCSMAD